MSDKLNTYSFLPWVREGIANQIENSDGNTDKLRTSIKLNFGVKGSGIGDDIISDPLMSKTVSLYGPGDVIGIDARNIIKTEPHNWITNFEPNYLPCIDFYDEDFPWRYSPAIPVDGKLMPWLALVVLEEGKFELGNDVTNKPLPFFKLTEGNNANEVFQPSDHLWAWAHVHVNTDLITGESADEKELVFEKDANKMGDIVQAYNDLLNANPDNAYSRIMCPIKLKTNTAYHAFLIPAFESGRLAGLGLGVDDIFNGEDAEDERYKPTIPAWGKLGDTEFRVDADTFPIYYQWYFRTGNAGDFEYLVRLLDPQPIDARVGTRNMDVTDPGYGITGILDSEEAPEGETTPELGDVLRLGGALMIPEDYRDNPAEYEKYENWDKHFPRKFQKELAAFINLASDFNEKKTEEAYDNDELPSGLPVDKEADDPDPLITPPLYGRWHSLSKKLLTNDPDNPDDNWVHKINLDPRHRTTAGFGTKIVQKNQDTYLEAAWDQVGDILEANRRIREAQMAKEVAKRWYFKYLEPIRISNPEAYIGITQPLHRRLVSEVSTQSARKQFYTVHHQVSISKVPGIVLSTGIRTFSRPGSRLSKKLGFDPKLNPAEKLVSKINNDEIVPAPPKKIPEGVSSINNFGEASRPQKVAGFLLKWAEKYKWLKWVFLGLSLVLLALLIIFVGPNLSNITLGFGSLSGAGLLFAILLFYLFLLFSKWENQIAIIPGLTEENQTQNAIDNLPMKPDFKLTVAGDTIDFKTGEEDSKEGERFKQGLADAAEILQANIAAAAVKERPPLETDNIVKATSAAINPVYSIPRYILKSQVNIPSRLVKERGPEVFKEAMAYPELDFPMYKPMADISADLFLPNINYVAQNSISLLETNQEFIEAYMVGLNHEFARELLWREYPTDQRGTYFRQFWDVSDFQFDPVDDEKFKKLAREEIAKEKPDEEATDDEINEKVEELKRESLMDITRLHKWNRRPSKDDANAHLLGTHDNREQYRKEKLDKLEEESNNDEDKKEVVLVIRGELLKKYPNTVIYAHKAQWQPTEEGGIIPNPAVERILKDPPGDPELFTRDYIKTPIFEAQVEPDIYFFGFDLTTDVAVGKTDVNPQTLDDGPGWFFVIKERPGEPRFGLDIGDGNSAIEVWNDMSWGELKPPVSEDIVGGNYIRFSEATGDITVVGDLNDIDPDNQAEKEEQWGEDKQITWHKEMNSSEIAYILYQAPVMMAVHAVEMLPKKTNKA